MMRGQNVCATIAEEMIFRILVIVCRVSKGVIDKVRRPDGSIGLTPLYSLHSGGGQIVCCVE